MLKDEFEIEVKNTRKILQAVPEKDLSYKPSPTSWTMGELARHIATIYDWYVGTLTRDEYAMPKDAIEPGSTSDLGGTLELFERNVEKAREALDSINDDKLREQWTMKSSDDTVMGPMPRGILARGIIFNHIYHHRGEMIVYLIETGNKVPGLYGPT